MIMIKTHLRRDLRELTEEETVFLSTLGILEPDSWTAVHVSDKEYIKYHKLFREIVDTREVLI